MEFKRGPSYKFRQQRFWSEGGLICIENQDNGEFKVLTRVEAAARAMSLNAELRYCTYPDERDELCSCVVGLSEAVKEAKRQGDPTDYDVRKQRIKDARKVSILFDGSDPTRTVSQAQKDLGGTLISGGQVMSIINPNHSDRFRKLRI